MRVKFNGKEVTKAVLHCAAVSGDWYRGHSARSAVDEIRRWHLAQGWADIGYHFVVMPDGTYSSGRSLSRQGAHCPERNRDAIGILMIERRLIDRLRTFQDYFMPEQVATVREILRAYEIKEVSGHNDWDKRLCPGFKVRPEDWL